MPAVDVPTLGNALLCLILVSAGYTFAVSLAATRGRPRLVGAARWSTLATVAFIVAAVFLLAYAFQAHDFRIRYVARYSDRSMSPLYLWTSLWGGQDGSLLWWSFLLSMYTLGFTAYLRNRWLDLQPWIFATLSTIFAFFAILMLFAANPFSVTHGAAPADGEGLNPLLQNYWMVIHPPCLYLGLTGWAIPFSIVVAALATGRLGDEWLLMARRWVLLAWGFLSFGNLLGMFWSYEELGWGGYWAWDPVENASFMPWLLATAFVHSTMIQERRGMLKVWNVSLLAGTFFFTIFGTFLTRSGLIASVHSFARSDIGIYFGWYMGALAIYLVTLIAWRLPELRGKRIDVGDLFDAGVPRFAALFLAPLLAYSAIVERVRMRLSPPPAPTRRPPAIESMLSREFAFLLNNWILLAMLVFVLVSTTFPLLSEWLRDETVTVGPPFYNRWMVPLGLMLLVLMGIGPLVAWRKATGKNLAEAFRVPVAVASVALAFHRFAGASLGFPHFVDTAAIYDTATGEALATIYGYAPMAAVGAGAFALATVVQEFARGIAMRRRNAQESFPIALVNLVARARRRYGGYIVHIGIVLAYLGFAGAAYDQEREAALRPGGTLEIAGYTLRYDDSRMEVDANKRMVFADMTLLDGEREIARLSPAKFIYRSHPEMPTSEVAVRSTPYSDVYVILSTVDPESHRATIRVVHRPFVFWIWFGGGVLLLGTLISAFPSLREILGDAPPPRRTGAVVVAGALLAVLLGGAALWSPPLAHAQSDSSSSLHAGTVEIHDPTERQLFERLLCMCGDCQRLPLSSCGCQVAEDLRAEMRADLARGRSVPDIQAAYRERFGAIALAVPSDSGLDRALWAAPLAAIAIAFVSLLLVGRRWQRRAAALPALPRADAKAEPRTALDDRRDDELRRFEEE